MPNVDADEKVKSVKRASVGFECSGGKMNMYLYKGVLIYHSTLPRGQMINKSCCLFVEFCLPRRTLVYTWHSTWSYLRRQTPLTLVKPSSQALPLHVRTGVAPLSSNVQAEQPTGHAEKKQ